MQPPATGILQRLDVADSLRVGNREVKAVKWGGEDVWSSGPEFIAYAISGNSVNADPTDYTEITIPGTVEAGMMVVVVVGYPTTYVPATRKVARSGGGGDFTEIDSQVGANQTSGAMFAKVVDSADIADGVLRLFGDQWYGAAGLLLAFSGATTATTIGLVSTNNTSVIDTSAATGMLVQYATNYAPSVSPFTDTNLTRLTPDRLSDASNRPRMAAAYGPPQASVTGGPNGAAWGVHGALYLT